MPDGPGRFLYSYVQSLVMGKSDEDLTIADCLQDNLMRLLGIALLSLDQSGQVTESDGKHAALSRVKSYIKSNLADDSLSPAATARAQGLSLRNLYYLFESEGTTISRFIQDSRLEQCRKEIEDIRMSGRPISDIALAWGFKDTAHFSRAFRRRFGVTPRECRSARRL